MSDTIKSLPVEEFPVKPSFHGEPVAPRVIPALFHRSDGVQFDGCDPLHPQWRSARYPRSSHYLIGTNGRHLFSANSFSLALPESVTIPNHKLLLWRGLADVPWALAGQKTKSNLLVRIVAGDWTLTTKVIEGNYPNWRQVVPNIGDRKTVITLPEDHEFAQLVTGLPGGDLKDSPVDLVVKNGAVEATAGQSCITLEGARATGPDISIRLNRDYLLKAFAYGLTTIGLIDAMSPLHFTCEGRQMVVMPIRIADEIARPVHPPEAPAEPPAPEPQTNQPAPPEPQHERKTMTETIGHTNGATHNVARPTTPVPPAAEKPAIEVAIDKLDAFKVTFREALVGLTELTSLLRQAVRDQKTGEKEIHQVRLTLRSLQSVKI